MTTQKGNRSADGSSNVEWRVRRLSADVANETGNGLLVRKLTIRNHAYCSRARDKETGQNPMPNCCQKRASRAAQRATASS